MSIEPYPDQLLALLPDTDNQQVTLLQQDLQDIDLELFSDLAANDILFIDTTHVSKTGSDINRLYFCSSVASLVSPQLRIREETSFPLLATSHVHSFSANDSVDNPTGACA